jgi:hypothetical protein
MNSYQAEETPILGREGLLRLLEVIERLRARQRGEEGGSSWTTQKMATPQPGPASAGRAGVGGSTTDEPPDGGGAAGPAGQAGTARDFGESNGGNRGPAR